MPAPLRLLPILESGAVMKNQAVIDELDIARLESHRELDRWAESIKKQLRLALLASHRRRAWQSVALANVVEPGRTMQPTTCSVEHR